MKALLTGIFLLICTMAFAQDTATLVLAKGDLIIKYKPINYNQRDVQMVYFKLAEPGRIYSVSEKNGGHNILYGNIEHPSQDDIWNYRGAYYVYLSNIRNWLFLCYKPLP